MAVAVDVAVPYSPENSPKQAGEMVNTSIVKISGVSYPTVLTLDQIKVDSPCLFDDIDAAVDACCEAQKIYSHMPLTRRKEIIKAMRATAIEFAEDFALCAWSETKRGRYEDKLLKQKLAATSTPGVEDLIPVCYTGDHGMTTIDYAPYGVIGAVTPVTNPTATIINNCITITAGGNGVVFNPHPGATMCTNRAVAMMNQAVVSAGGPQSLVCSVRFPTVESGQRLLTHPKTACNLVTGGPAVVKVAMSSGKKSFCAGPGNPPVVVDETAELPLAAEGLYSGSSFDNNMICSDEKEVFVVESVADGLIEELKKCGAYIATEEETEKLTNVVLPLGHEPWKHGVVDKDLVGQNASAIMEKAGLTLSSDTRLIIVQVDKSHPLVWTEQLMPILPVVRVKSFEEALELSYKAEYGFKHTSSIYSSNLHHISDMAKFMNTSLFIVNGPHYAGLAAKGEGFTSFSIAGATGEGMTRPRTFVRERRLVCKDSLRFI